MVAHVFFLVFGVVVVAASTTYDYDVVVYGSTPAGIAAATAAGYLGMRVAVFEPLPMIGGMGAAGNLALHDGYGQNPLSGLALSFAVLNAQHYNVSKPVGQPESFVANASFFKMLHSAGVEKVALDCRLTAATAGAGGRVHSIQVLCERDPVTAAVFIDASYDGEIMVGVGTVDYTYGREAMSKYNETLAGARSPTQGNVEVDALWGNGVLIKYVQNISELAAPGESDEALMAFQHRLCISGDNDRLPWKKPAGYNRDDFVLFERYISANHGKFDGFGWPPQNLHNFGYPGPKKKYTLCCGVSIAASDQPNLNRGWATASWERKREIISDHTYFERGMFYFLANDPKVPQSVRDEFNRYGICADEFVEFDHIPPQLYIRESNRLVGDFVLTQNNIANPRTQHDSIATAHWWLDMHMTGKYGAPTAGGKITVQLEGDFPHNAATVLPSYDVPYRLMTPKRGTGTNLLIPVCLSTSHAAFASTRIEAMLMGVGSAAGVAAKQLVTGTAATVQDVDVSEVQHILSEAFKQVIHVDARLPVPPWPVHKRYDVIGVMDKAWNAAQDFVV
eukprot:TRINITY_DN71118_c0_g1_i1.p1 TRINITY_DN71118_c0_g1~~TRINITY_DN71118_c0_g1_i1.p1  ORF type:complete len:564 (+),score=80.86 TRINITY_DN71118_c0_g1_i1:79-1770(+)